MKLIFLFITGLYCSALFAQTNYLEPKLENISWIAGTWHGEAFGGVVEEIWSESSGGSMMATFKLMVNNEVVFYEIEIIREIENNLILQLKHFNKELKGWETKDQTIDFPLKYITENKVVFEGMSFEKINDNEMNVSVDLKEDDEVSTVTIHYKKKLQKPTKQILKVHKTATAPIIDGLATDDIWKRLNWHLIDQLWLGEAYDTTDFAGHYKLAWNNEALYILVEIQDDLLFDKTADPLKFWWDDDCVEVFIDEDNSGGEHQFNHNAFAYHVALDGNVVDLAPGNIPTLYNNHILSKRLTKGNTTIWEMKLFVYDNSFKDGEYSSPIKLHSNKQIGFALAYCDNDGSEFRENFIGSVPVEDTDKNRGWIDADIFGTLLLVNK